MSNENRFVITLGVDKTNAFRVTLAFTLGVAAFEKDLQPTIVLMMEGTHNARRGYVDDIDIGEPSVIFRTIMGHEFSPTWARCFHPRWSNRFSPKLGHA
jgi:predicted peroxiredoxin